MHFIPRRRKRLKYTIYRFFYLYPIKSFIEHMLHTCRRLYLIRIIFGCCWMLLLNSNNNDETNLVCRKKIFKFSLEQLITLWIEYRITHICIRSYHIYNISSNFNIIWNWTNITIVNVISFTIFEIGAILLRNWWKHFHVYCMLYLNGKWIIFAMVHM